MVTESKSGADGVGRGWTTRELLWVMEIFHIMIVVGMTRLDTFVKLHQILHLKLGNFIICKLYLIKTNFKISSG